MRQSVSVLVAAYDAAETLGATLSGILAQDYAGLVEAVVVDDGSSDATVKIARAFEGQHRNAAGWLRRVKVVSQANRGVAAARNRAISLVEGDFLTICDSDDVLLPGYLEAAIALLAEQGAEKCFVACNALVLTPTGINPGRPMLRDAQIPPAQQRLACLQYNIGSIFTVFPREMLAEVGGFDDELRSCEDWDLWLRAIYAGWTMLRQDVPQAIYRWTTSSLSTGTEALYRNQDAVLRKLLHSSVATLSSTEREAAHLRLAVGSPQRMVGRFEDALRADDLRAAKAALADIGKVASYQKRLMAKVRIAGIPGGIRLLRLRQRKLDALNGYHSGMVR